MRKLLLPALLAISTTACVGIDSITTPDLSGATSANTTRFTCDNGYKTSVSRQSDSRVTVMFNNGKDTFLVQTTNSHAAPDVYVNDLGNLKWQEKNGVAKFTYPDSQWRTTKKLWETTCYANKK